MLSLAARSWPTSRLQPRDKGSLSGDCWVYLHHCHMSLEQFFSCFLCSPSPSTFLCTYSISSSAVTQQHNLLTVRCLSSFSLLSLPSLHCRKQQGCTPQTYPWYCRRIISVTGNWGNWLGVTSGFGLEKKNNNKKNNICFIYLLVT